MTSIDDLSKYSAVALFLERAVAAKPDFELNQENSSAVAERPLWRAVPMWACVSKMRNPSFTEAPR